MYWRQKTHMWKITKITISRTIVVTAKSILSKHQGTFLAISVHIYSFNIEHLQIKLAFSKIAVVKQGQIHLWIIQRIYETKISKLSTVFGYLEFLERQPHDFTISHVNDARWVWNYWDILWEFCVQSCTVRLSVQGTCAVTVIVLIQLLYPHPKIKQKY